MIRLILFSSILFMNSFAEAVPVETVIAPGTIPAYCEGPRDAFRYQTGVYRAGPGEIEWTEEGDLAVELEMSFIVCTQLSDNEYGYIYKSPYERVVYRHSPPPPQGRRYIEAFEVSWVDVRSFTNIYMQDRPLEILDRQRLTDEARQTYSFRLPAEAVRAVNFSSGETLQGSFLLNIIKSGYYVYSDGSRAVNGIPYQPFSVKFEIRQTPQGLEFQKFEVQ